MQQCSAQLQQQSLWRRTPDYPSIEPPRPWVTSYRELPCNNAVRRFPLLLLQRSPSGGQTTSRAARASPTLLRAAVRTPLMRGAVVTGAASGIGAAMAEALVNAGYNVVLFDIGSSQQTLDKLLAIRPRSAMMIQGDVRKLEDIRAAIKAVNDHYAPFRVLINSAGIGTRASLQSTSILILEAEAPGFPFSQV